MMTSHASPLAETISREPLWTDV